MDRSLLAMVKKTLKLAKVFSCFGLLRHSRHDNSNMPVAAMMLYVVRTAVASSIGDSPARAKSMQSSIWRNKVSMGVVGCHGVAMVIRLASKSSALMSPYVVQRWVMIWRVVTVA